MDDALKSMIEDVRVQLGRLEEHWDEDGFPRDEATNELLCRMEDLDVALLEAIHENTVIVALDDVITCPACREIVPTGKTCHCNMRTTGPIAERDTKGDVDALVD